MLRGPGDVPRPRQAAGRCVSALSRPRARLFCFHHASGSAEMFEPFAELAAMGIEVHTVSHTRANPPSIEAARQFLAEVAAYIEERSSDVPYALFGHSLGAWIAWRVLEELFERRVAPPQLFVPSAAAFPESLAGDFSPDALSRALRRIIGDTGPRAETTDTLLDDFSADALLWRDLPPSLPRPLPVRVAAFVGRADPLASEPAMRAWAERTSSHFSATTVAGNHFYVNELGPRHVMLTEVARLLLEVGVEVSAAG
jgi:surfactin synthase thioesterase subunit